MARERSRRTGSILVPVMGVALIVSAVAFSALMIARLQLKQAQGDNQLDEARWLALSGSEHGVSVLTSDVDWRSRYVNGQENFPTPLGGGAMSWKLFDPDGNLSDDPTDPVQILGIGRVGAAVWVSGVTFDPPRDVGPASLRSYAGGAFPLQLDISSNQWRGQYFKPNLPADTLEWQVTSVEFVAEQSGAAGQTLTVRLYTPNGSQLPGTQIDSATVAESSLPVGLGWYAVGFTGNSGLDPATGLCLTLESSTALPAARIGYEGGGVAESDSHLIEGSQTTGWTTTASDQALHYKIHGICKVNGHLVPATWTREPSP